MNKIYPENWSQEKLSNISLDITVGFVGTMSNFFVEEGVPLLRGQNIKPYTLDLSNLKYIPEHIHKKWKKSSLRAGDVVIVRVGYPGTACVIPKGLGELNAASLVIVRPDKTKLNSYFLTYLLNSPWGQATISGMLVGAAQQVFNTTSAADLVIPYPPISIQNRIADILSAYDDLIVNNTRRIRILEQMTQAIYQEWFGNVDKESLRDGWEFKRLGDVTTKIGSGATPTGGKNAYKERGISLIRSQNIYDFNFTTEGLAFIDDKQADRLDNVTVQPNDILLNITGASVARCCMVPSYVLPARVNQHVSIIRTDPKLSNSFYILYTINNDSNKKELLNLAQGGATREAITKSTLENYRIIHPPNQLLEKFGKVAESMFYQHEKLIRKNANLRQTRDLLLPRLVSGEVEVTEDD